MPRPMSPADAVFLMVESREQPMHVGGLQLFVPPDGATAMDVRALFKDAVAADQVGELFRKRPTRSLATLGQWAWEPDDAFDIEHHVRFNALPHPGRVRELLALCSRLHSTLLDRHRPLWELHLIEGLDDGRFATYFKVHHSLVDGVGALRMMARQLSSDAGERGMPPPWAPKARPPRPHGDGGLDLAGLAREVLGKTSEVAGLVPVLSRTVRSSLNKQTTSMSFAAPRSILNTRITGARRFAAQSWPLDRIKGVARRTDHTLNDVVLAMCAGALRAYLFELGELPDEPMIAMVPVSLHGNASSSRDPEGNSIGEVMCNLGTDQVEAADRLAVISASMTEGKRMLGTMTPMQVIAMSGLGLAPLLLQPALGLVGHARPPFNLTISNVPGPRRPMYWNGARLDGLYPLSIPLDGQALNITCTSYAGEIGFGLIGCRRCVPHLQRLLVHLEDALQDLEKVAA